MFYLTDDNNSFVNYSEKPQYNGLQDNEPAPVITKHLPAIQQTNSITNSETQNMGLFKKKDGSQTGFGKLFKKPDGQPTGLFKLLDKASGIVTGGTVSLSDITRKPTETTQEANQRINNGIAQAAGAFVATTVKNTEPLSTTERSAIKGFTAVKLQQWLPYIIGGAIALFFIFKKR